MGEQEAHRQEHKEGLVLAFAMPDTDWHRAMRKVFQLFHEFDILCQLALEACALVRGNARDVTKQIDGSSLCSRRAIV